MEKGINPSESNIRRDQEIDFKEIYFRIIRNKKLIIYFTSFSFFLSGIFSLTLKKVWLGEFQIVLETKTNDLPARGGTALPFDINSELKTQVGILKSPLVLSKVFDFLLNKKIN